MKPPDTMNVIDKHGGYTVRELNGPNAGGTLHIHFSCVPTDATGDLVSFNERSFYQTNNNVTSAEYRVKGEKRPVVVWFDNVTGARIA